jgi:hypothetical protein
MTSALSDGIQPRIFGLSTLNERKYQQQRTILAKSLFNHPSRLKTLRKTRVAIQEAAVAGHTLTTMSFCIINNLPIIFEFFSLNASDRRSSATFLV